MPDGATTSFKLEILGSSITINTVSPKEHLENILEEYRKVCAEVAKIEGVKTEKDIAILSGYMLCEELAMLRESLSSPPEDPELEHITSDIIARIDKQMMKNAE